eukprot:Tamp_19420.p1 GENE.Tamp_19420~~Tamp_19420.p1  ORF type:complete len:186 (-),score=38.21 Tamp_19420:376-933(-)
MLKWAACWKPITKSLLSRREYQGWMYLEQVFRMMGDMGFQDRDLEDIKDLLSGSSLRVLALTYVVVGLHVLFDCLAFKEDIGFFMGREDYTGLSSRTLLSGFVCFFIQFLYLLDNDGTSRIVLVSVFSSVCVEGWKAVKVTKAGIQMEYMLPWLVSRRFQALPPPPPPPQAKSRSKIQRAIGAYV